MLQSDAAASLEAGYTAIMLEFESLSTASWSLESPYVHIWALVIAPDGPSQLDTLATSGVLQLLYGGASNISMGIQRMHPPPPQQCILKLVFTASNAHGLKVIASQAPSTDQQTRLCQRMLTKH